MSFCSTSTRLEPELRGGGVRGGRVAFNASTGCDETSPSRTHAVFTIRTDGESITYSEWRRGTGSASAEAPHGRVTYDTVAWRP